MNPNTTNPETTAPVRVPLIGETAPAFKAHTTRGPIDLPKDDEGIVPPPGSCGTAQQRVDQPDADAYALDWFMTSSEAPPQT